MLSSSARLLATLCCSFVLLQTAAHADEKLARAKACMACHSVERKIVGPAFKEIASKRAGEADAAQLLADHIRNGSKGVYGAVPMPPNPRVTEAEAQQMAEWILTLQPGK